VQFSRQLPERFRDLVSAMPEYSYGATRIRVTLDDGSQIDDVFVAWGSEIVNVGVSNDICFDPSRIVAVAAQ
jgi:hypothetical protein